MSGSWRHSALLFRLSNLTQVNTLLREQLDQAHLANRQLNDDLRHRTNELQQLREELTKKTIDWKEEERVSSAIICLYYILY